MQFDHERLDVYRVSLEFAAWCYRLSGDLKGPQRHIRDQLLRASSSIPLNIAEGNGKLPGLDRRRFLRIAYGSALECAATLDLLEVFQALPASRLELGRALLHRIVAMLISMTGVADRAEKSPGS